jgi:hypothetical protein
MTKITFDHESCLNKIGSITIEHSRKQQTILSVIKEVLMSV